MIDLSNVHPADICSAAVLSTLIIRVNTAGTGSSEIKCCISRAASIVLSDGYVE